jgi:hypothetical protein
MSKKQEKPEKPTNQSQSGSVSDLGSSYVTLNDPTKYNTKTGYKKPNNE